jgi:hypothetical protein
MAEKHPHSLFKFRVVDASRGKCRVYETNRSRID